MTKFVTSVICVLALFVAARVAVAGPDLSSPKSAAMSFAKALEAGDAATAKASAVATEEEGKFIDVMAGMMSGMLKLKAASIAKFGDAGKDIAGSSDDVEISKQIETAEVKEEGDVATLITKKDEGKPLQLKKVGGEWKVDISSMTQGEDVSKAMPLFKAMSEAMTELTKEITDGKYADVDGAKTAFGMKMMAAMASMGSQQGGGGAGATREGDVPPSTQPSDK